MGDLKKLARGYWSHKLHRWPLTVRSPKVDRRSGQQPGDFQDHNLRFEGKQEKVLEARSLVGLIPLGNMNRVLLVPTLDRRGVQGKDINYLYSSRITLSELRGLVIARNDLETDRRQSSLKYRQQKDLIQ